MNDPLVEAVNLLIEAENYSSLAAEMTRLIEHGSTEVQYGMGLAPLNALVELGRTDRNAFERVLVLVEGKRKEDPKSAKRDYQRDIMRERRQRMAKAILLHEARVGALKGGARATEMAEIRKRWTRAKAQYIVDSGATSAEDRRQAVQSFWAMVDRQLDANLANMQRTAAVA